MTGLIIKFKNITIGGLFLLAFVVYNHVYPGLNFLLMIVLNEKGWKINFLFPVCMTGTIYVVFIILLNSNLPKGTLF